MPERSISLRHADTRDLDRIEALLEQNGLPSEDVRTTPGTFFVASQEDETDAEVVGIGGVEVHGSAGLLRSLVVAEPHRGTGYGRALCGELERYAESAGVSTLYLLTTTATGFFRDCGYDTIDREDAPATIRDTTEFSDLCPGSADCMKKHL